MFGRKKSDSGNDKNADLQDDLGIPMKPGARVPPDAALAPARPTAPTVPQRPPELPRRPADLAPAGTATPAAAPLTAPASAAPGLTPAPATAPAAPALTPIAPQKAPEPEPRKLIVGREISLSGEITSCDRLVVEGTVEANLSKCRDMEIAESGVFKGTATIDDAEIRGKFEGTLTVKKRLLIRGPGKVTGTVRYGQLEIECGGQLSGDIQAQPASGEELKTAV